MEFHDHLKRLREAKGLTQVQAAEAVGIAKNTYIGYEKGSREPRLSELKKLAALFQVKLGELCLESQESGLTGYLEHTLKQASNLKAREKAALLEVIRGYIESRLMASILTWGGPMTHQEAKEEAWKEEAEKAILEQDIERAIEEEEMEELSRR